jgi:hypothetical protein
MVDLGTARHDAPPADAEPPGLAARHHERDPQLTGHRAVVGDAQPAPADRPERLRTGVDLRPGRSDRPPPAGRRGVRVPRPVAGADLERVLAVGKAAQGHGGRASRPRAGVQPALEDRARLGGELELGGGRRRERSVGGAGGQAGLRRRAVHHPRPLGRHGLDVARGVPRPDLEAVRAVAQARDRRR